MGFKSMLDTFISRTPFKYNIPSLDRLLESKEIPDSFLMYDEQVLSILISAAIAASDSYVCLKGIKKKKMDKVEAFKERFREGFSKHLKEEEHATEEEANKIVDNVWGIIEASASYLFNASHSLCMACDSLYVAWLKAHYPYELYLTMLEIFDEKKKSDKISKIIDEMKRYKGIKLLSGRWGQDNRDWAADKEHATISQSISSIKYMAKQVAEDLYNLSQQEEAYIGTTYTTDKLTPEAAKEIKKIEKQLKPLQKKGEAYLAAGGSEFDSEFLDLYDQGYPLEQEIKRIKSDESSYLSRGGEHKHYAKLDCFTNVLRAIQMNTCLDMRQIEILIGLNYFEPFGKTGKLMKIFYNFFNGEKKITKSIKSFEERLELSRQYESSLDDLELPVGSRLRYEYDNVGLCLSVDPTAPSNLYFVTEIDDKYSIKVKMYSVQRGTAGEMKITKKDYMPISVGTCIVLESFDRKPKYTYNKGQRTVVPGETECWMRSYHAA